MSHRKRRKTFREVHLFQNAMDAAMEVFHLFRQFPEHEEQEELASDIIRGTRIVCAKIAAAWESRRTGDVCLAYLKVAKTHTAETLVFLDVAHGLGYLDVTQRDRLFDTYRSILRRLDRLITKWQRSSNDFLDRYGTIDED